MGDYSEKGSIEKDVVASALKNFRPPPLTEDSLATAIASAGLVPKATIDKIRAELKGRRLYQALLDEQIASEEDLRDLMSRTFQIPSIDLNKSPVDNGVAAEFPARLAREHLVMPVSRESENIILAISDPTDTETVERVRREVRL